MKRHLAALVVAPLALATHAGAANTAPTVIIKSATMRGATGLMDVVFRVNDPDDATVKARALAFIDGQRSFAKVIKPTTFAEGTESKLGDAIASNTDHTLTWNVAADWNISLGQIKFEILAMDTRGLVPLEWVTIPAANGQPELTISKNAPTDQQTLDALFWQYASGDPGLTLENGILRANATAGTFSGVPLVSGSMIGTYGPAWVFRSMNLTPADGTDVERAFESRADISNFHDWHVIKKPYHEIDVLIFWGKGDDFSFQIPRGITKVVKIACGNSGNGNLIIRNNGTILEWGSGSVYTRDYFEEIVVDIAVGRDHRLALLANGRVIAWGDNRFSQATVPDNVNDAVAVAAGRHHSMALTRTGTVFAWGSNGDGQCNVPAGLNDVVSIGAGDSVSYALKGDGTVVQWGSPPGTIPVPPSKLSAITVGTQHALGLKPDGTVLAWGDSSFYDATSVPIGLSGIKMLTAGFYSSYALSVSGTVLAWGNNSIGQTNVPKDLGMVSAISAGTNHVLALKKAP